jgi:hypothetical protein
MTTDDRDILEILKTELDFIEQGGYGRSVRTPWQPKSPFQDSLSCINYADPARTHSCDECHLIDFVPDAEHSQDVPCHFIPLDQSGETVDQLETLDDEAKLERVLKAWLKSKISTIEAERAAAS